MEVNGQLHAPHASPPAKVRPCLLSMRLYGPQSQYEHFAEEKNHLLWGESNHKFLGRPTRTLLATDYNVPASVNKA